MKKNINNSKRLLENKSSDIQFYWTLIFLLISIKTLFLWKGALLPDEAYYWLWSKNIDMSFYDHPPLSSWVQAIFSFAHIGKYFEIRIVPTVCFIIMFFFIIFSTSYDCLLATFANYCYSLLTDLTLIAKLNAIVCEYSQYGFGEIFCVQRR